MQPPPSPKKLLFAIQGDYRKPELPQSREHVIGGIPAPVDTSVI